MAQAAAKTHRSRLVRGSAGPPDTGNDQSLALDFKVSTTSYLELGGQAVGEGEKRTRCRVREQGVRDGSLSAACEGGVDVVCMA